MQVGMTMMHTTAHPRSRGENVSFRWPESAIGGSSPLTRGKLRWRRNLHHYRRLIPAHAGKTSPLTTGVADSWAHPRSRGENGRLHGLDEEGAGSSPLTRGKRGLHNQGLEGGRLIPAHAGKTLRRRLLRVNLRAHPRSRGENLASPLKARLKFGSSPLTRGKLDIGDVGQHFSGLIPAHTGKTENGGKAWNKATAHPRSRGENVELSRVPIRDYGSSPLTRGKPNAKIPNATIRGLIPAHAGKTQWRATCPRRFSAHPRSRGENLVDGIADHDPDGSSPLTRGKPPSSRAMALIGGLIPAHAGKTREACAAHACLPAHPRSRGENVARLQNDRPRRGSSPLTRGKHQRWPEPYLRRRLIPAHAGKTRSPRAPMLSRSAHPRSRGENILSVLGGSLSPGSSPLTRGKPGGP